MSAFCATAAFVKTAIDIARGDLPSRAISSTIGHAGIFPISLLLTPQTHVNPSDWRGEKGYLDPTPSKEDARAKKLQQVARAMERSRKYELQDHQVYLGGPRTFRDIRRIVENPRTSVFGKTLGLASYPAQWLNLNLRRSNAYSPLTNSTYLYANSPAILSHELGHAIDFNSWRMPKYSDKENKIWTWMKRQGVGLARDAHTLSNIIPGFTLYNEARANSLSAEALKKSLKRNPKLLNQILSERQQVLPAGYGSYAGAFLGGPAGALPGMAAGKLYGLIENLRRDGLYADVKSKKKKTDLKTRHKTRHVD